MKRFIVCIMVFVLMLWFSGNSVHAKAPNRLQIISSEVEMDSSDNLIFNIYGLNFGDAPQVRLENYPEAHTLDVNSSSNDYIEATLVGGILPGTYRLSVARKGFDFSHPEKADSLDVTISDVNADPKSGDPGESSGALERENIYEIQETSTITNEGNAAIKCSCNDKNDIALNGGYKITLNLGPGSTYPELTILESNLYYSEVGNDFYQLSFYNPIALTSYGGDIKIDAYLRCIKIPNE